MNFFRPLLASLFLFLFLVAPSGSELFGMEGKRFDERKAPIEKGAKRTAKNSPSSDKSVHTYELIGLEASEDADDDEASQEGEPQLAKALLEKFSSMEGVRRASFDRATATITVLSDKDAALPETIRIK